MDMRGIAPGLLLAMPQLPDPNFARSVVLMIEHNEQGSLGLVVNRPTELSLAEVLDSLGIEWAGASDALVWSGGPVEQQSGWLLHSRVPATDAEGRIVVTDDLVVSTSPDELRALAELPPDHLRFLMGYAGWGAGQLEMELATGSWLVAQATPELVFETPAPEMWETAIRTLGVDPASLVSVSGVH